MKLREQGAGGVYVASTFKQEVEWTRPGKETSITLRDSEKEVPGVSMKSVQAYEHRLPDGTTVRVYMLKTKNGDIVSLMPYRGNVRKESLLGFSKDVVEPVATAARNERKRFDEARKEYNSRVDVDEATRDAVLNSRLKPVEELRFPMVDLDEKADLSWLQGARMGDVVIREAKAQFQLQMDEKGAVAKAAVGLGTLRGGGPRPDIIDGPMIVWFERDGVVTFSALVGTSDFKKPNRQK